MKTGVGPEDKIKIEDDTEEDFEDVRDTLPCPPPLPPPAPSSLSPVTFNLTAPEFDDEGW
jgi:hypothetical protein